MGLYIFKWVHGEWWKVGYHGGDNAWGRILSKIDGFEGVLSPTPEMCGLVCVEDVELVHWFKDITYYEELEMHKLFQEHRRGEWYNQTGVLLIVDHILKLDFVDSASMCLRPTIANQYLETASLCSYAQNEMGEPIVALMQMVPFRMRASNPIADLLIQKGFPFFKFNTGVMSTDTSFEMRHIVGLARMSKTKRHQNDLALFNKFFDTLCSCQPHILTRSHFLLNAVSPTHATISDHVGTFFAVAGIVNSTLMNHLLKLGLIFHPEYFEFYSFDMTLKDRAQSLLLQYPNEIDEELLNSLRSWACEWVNEPNKKPNKKRGHVKRARNK